MIHLGKRDDGPGVAHMGANLVDQLIGQVWDKAER